MNMKKLQVVVAIPIGFAAPLRRVLVTFMLLWCYPCWASFTAIQGWIKASGANTCTTKVTPTGAGHVGIFCKLLQLRIGRWELDRSFGVAGR